MKKILRNLLAMALIAGTVVVSLTGCYETHYYHHYHHHTRDWYDRHHEPVPAGVDFNVEIHN
jgi:hypothetical protein